MEAEIETLDTQYEKSLQISDSTFQVQLHVALLVFWNGNRFNYTILGLGWPRKKWNLKLGSWNFAQGVWWGARVEKSKKIFKKFHAHAKRQNWPKNHFLFNNIPLCSIRSHNFLLLSYFDYRKCAYINCYQCFISQKW